MRIEHPQPPVLATSLLLYCILFKSYIYGSYCPVLQWYSTWGTRVICDTLTKNIWHFAFIFTWHFDAKMLRKWHPGKTNAKYTCQAISPVYVYCMYMYCIIAKAREKSLLTIAYKTDIIKKWIKNREDIMKIWYIREIFGN